jgi:hypothetical protein
MPQVFKKILDGALLEHLALISRKYPMTIPIEEIFLFNPLQDGLIF